MYITVILPDCGFTHFAKSDRAKIQLLFKLQAQMAYFFHLKQKISVHSDFLSILHFVSTFPRHDTTPRVTICYLK